MTVIRKVAFCPAPGTWRRPEAALADVAGPQMLRARRICTPPSEVSTRRACAARMRSAHARARV